MDIIFLWLSLLFLFFLKKSILLSNTRPNITCPARNIRNGRNPVRTMNRNPTYQLSCVCLADSVLSWRWNGWVRWGWRSAAHRLEDSEKKEASHGDPSLTSVPTLKRVVFPFTGLSPHKANWLSSQPPCRLNLIGLGLDTTDIQGALLQLNSLYWHMVEHFCTNRKLTVTLGDNFIFFSCSYLLVSDHCWTLMAGCCGYGGLLKSLPNHLLYAQENQTGKFCVCPTGIVSKRSHAGSEWSDKNFHFK